MIYKALDFGLKENEERELSPPLEQLIDLMTNMSVTEVDACSDEGYEATEEEDEGEEEQTVVSSVRGYKDIIALCTSHLPSSSDASSHYQAVCRALFAETKELRTFLEKIRNAKENLRRMGGETPEAPVRDLNELQNDDWARFWVQVMRDLRNGVMLKKVQERQYDPLPIEYQLTPYEMLMDDIRFKRYKLRKVMEEFCHPVECLTLTVEEVMHIRLVLVKAELEKFQQYKEVYNALKKGKLCFSCRIKKFSFFTWSYTCQFCKRPVCSQCCKKMKLPSKPHAHLPIYALGPTAHVEKSSPIQRNSLKAYTSRQSRHGESSTPRDEVEFPKDLTEDWSTMDVCMDCRNFINDIISSSKRSLSVASTRSRMKRKTQSFYMSPSRSREFRPSERTIKEV
ncbi:protein spire homolog 1 isoform X3 [Tachysurus ichikawai]